MGFDLNLKWLKPKQYGTPDKQEKGWGKETNGEPQPCSGRLFHKPMDVIDKKMLWDCKQTKTKQYILKREDIENLKKEAIDQDRDYGFQIDFMGGESVVVISKGRYKELVDVAAE